MTHDFFVTGIRLSELLFRATLHPLVWVFILPALADLQSRQGYMENERMRSLVAEHNIRLANGYRAAWRVTENDGHFTIEPLEPFNGDDTVIEAEYKFKPLSGKALHGFL